MSRLIDVSVPLHNGMPFWPDTPGFRRIQFRKLADGDSCNNSRLETDVHIGTHVDAPLHFVERGAGVDQLPLEDLVGPATVGHLPGADSVGVKELESLSLAGDVRRLLLRTRNSLLWEQGHREFQSDFVGLTAEAAQWLVDRGIRLIGVDYLSVQRFTDGPRTHEILLGAGVVILEGLNLSRVEPGVYELMCLPVLLAGSDGAPCRAVLRPLPSDEPKPAPRG